MMESSQTDHVEKKPLAQKAITNLESLRVAADPLRIQILEQMAVPVTVKEVASALEMVPTKLYYHVNLLEKHDLIRVVETNIVSGIIEKKYQVTAYSFALDKSLLNVGEEGQANVDMVLSAIFDKTKQQIKESVRHGKMKLGDSQQELSAMLSHLMLGLTVSQFQELETEMKAVIEKYSGMNDELSDEDSKKLTRYGFTIALYPIQQVDENQ